MSETTTRPGIWTLRGREYLMLDRAGKPVSKGDTVTSFRGTPYAITYLSRGPDYNGFSKVCTDDNREHGATAFDLSVLPLIEQGGRYRVGIWDPEKRERVMHVVRVDEITVDRSVRAQLLGEAGEISGTEMEFAWGNLHCAEPLTD